MTHGRAGRASGQAAGVVDTCERLATNPSPVRLKIDRLLHVAAILRAEIVPPSTSDLCSSSLHDHPQCSLVGLSRRELNLRQVRKVWRADRGKAQCRALDRGWAPFAPHPGPAHLHPWELVSTTESQDQLSNAPSDAFSRCKPSPGTKISGCERKRANMFILEKALLPPSSAPPNTAQHGSYPSCDVGACAVEVVEACVISSTLVAYTD